MGVINVSKGALITDIMFMIVFIACSIFSENTFFSVASVLGFVLYLIYLIQAKPLLLAKYFSFFFAIAITISGTIMLEFTEGRFLPEIVSYSEYVGSLPLYIFSWWIFLVTIKYYEIQINKPVEDISYFNDKSLSVFNCITFIVYLGLFLQVCTHPAFFLGVDRFTYFQLYPLSPFWQRLDNVSAILLVFPIISIVCRERRIWVFSLVLYVMYYLWNGNKFGPFFNLIIIFLLIYYQRLACCNLKSFKSLFMKAIVLLSSLIIVTFSIVYNSGVDLDRYIWNRASQQGQLWWKTYDLTQGETHFAEFEDEIIAILNGPLGKEDLVGANNGIYKIMYLCAPESVIDWKLGTGSRYTEAGMAAVYYYFGAFGVILFAAIMGFIVAATVNCFLRFIANNNLIAAMLMLRIFMIERTFLSMFTMADFFKPLSLLSYIYLYFAWNRVPIIKFRDGIRILLKRC